MSNVTDEGNISYRDYFLRPDKIVDIRNKANSNVEQEIVICSTFSGSNAKEVEAD